MYNTEVEYSYKCDECHHSVNNSKHHRTCAHCSINLCNGCFKKRRVNLCLWCYNRNPDKYIWRLKFTRILMIVIPILILLIPIPVPLLYRIVVWDNTDNLVMLGIGFLVISIVIFCVLEIRCSNKMMDYLKNR